MKLHHFNFLFFMFLVSACSFYNIKSEETTLDYYPPRSSKDSVVYIENVDKPHTIIGNVTVNVERNQAFSEILDKMKQEAAVLGGDAITDITQDVGKGRWAKIKPKLFANSNIRQNYNAKVIVFGQLQKATSETPEHLK